MSKKSLDRMSLLSPYRNRQMVNETNSIHRGVIPLPIQHISSEELVLRYGSVLRGAAIECPSGWHQLVAGTLQCIEDVSVAAGIPLRRWPYVQQLKEKFGWLTIYMVIPKEVEDEIQIILRDAGEQSSRTCIFCGGPGQMRNAGWIHPACEACEQVHSSSIGGQL